VIVARHAEAAPGDPDETRPLTAQGRAAARLLGELLAERRPDAVVSSPLLRARETAEAIAEAAGVEAAVDDHLVPGADADDLRAAVEGRGATVVAVGHHPDCSKIVLALTGRSVQFPTAGFTEIEL
jgi:phosphohistidine phosphatase SixA